MKGNSALDRLRVSTPCREDWNLMSGGDRVRFCSQCEKSVHDISRMTRSEAEALVAGRNVQLCVRFYREIDGSIRTEDEAALSPRLANGSRLVNATLAGLLAFQVATQAQSHDRVAGAPTPVQVTREEKRAKPRPKPQVLRSSLSGTVMDLNKAVIVGARVRITNTLTSETNTIFSSDSGRFEFRNVESGDYTLEADAPGLPLFQSRVSLQQNTAARLDVILEPSGLIMGGPVFVDGIVERSPIPRDLLTPIKVSAIVPERRSK